MLCQNSVFDPHHSRSLDFLRSCDHIKTVWGGFGGEVLVPILLYIASRGCESQTESSLVLKQPSSLY